MESLEKSKLALRKYISENKEKVISDLENMRKMSDGCDIEKYVEKLSESLSLKEILVKKNTT